MAERENVSVEEAAEAQPVLHRRVDLFKKLPLLKRVVKLRSFQFLVILPNFILFALFLMTGLLGSPVGNRNIIIVFVWIVWWFMLITVMVPFGSRVWCTVCPLPSVGEWLQRLRLIGVRSGEDVGTRNRFFGLKRRWPKALSNIWFQNLGFLALATFSVLLVTRPIVSVGVLGGMILIGAVLALIYRLRSFCQYICPISGFLSLYSMTSTVELRSVDREVCTRKCRYKGCIRGSKKGWACPWGVYMGGLDRNNYCGLCFECVKSCPYDNISLFLRPFGSDTKIKGYDEAWKAFIMLTLALVYSVTLLGPWGTVKDWANVSEVGNWAGFGIYAAIILGAALVVTPALHWAFSFLSKLFAGAKEVTTKEIFLKYSYVFVPLGLLAWIAFSVPLLMVNGSYAITVLSDPFGRGWDLFGTADFPWTPFHPDWVPYVQVGVLMLGLYHAIKGGARVGWTMFAEQGQVVRSLIPFVLLLTGFTVIFLRLYAG